MTHTKLADGAVHALPPDLRKAFGYDPVAATIWKGLTPLARNEWICWIITVKQQKTRENHLQRALNEIKQGKRRPCCWIGCIHRLDKPISPSVKAILGKGSRPKLS